MTLFGRANPRTSDRPRPAVCRLSFFAALRHKHGDGTAMIHQQSRPWIPRDISRRVLEKRVRSSGQGPSEIFQWVLLDQARIGQHRLNGRDSMLRWIQDDRHPLPLAHSVLSPCPRLAMIYDVRQTPRLAVYVFSLRDASLGDRKAEGMHSWCACLTRPHGLPAPTPLPRQQHLCVRCNNVSRWSPWLESTKSRRTWSVPSANRLSVSFAALIYHLQ